MALEVSGRYEGVLATFLLKKAQNARIELRIDVDGKRPLNVVSADIYSNSGITCKHLGSFVFRIAKRKIQNENEIILVGESLKFDSKLGSLHQFRVRITLDSHPLMAEVSWICSSSVEACLCEYKSRFFRRVNLQNDYEEGVTPFNSYNMNTLSATTQNGASLLTVTGVYAESGIEIVVEKKTALIPHPKQIFDRGSVWTDKALNEAMAKYFDVNRGQPGWSVWLLSAFEYEVPDFKGIMIACEGHIRGCAIFHRAIGGGSDDEKRMLLYVYIHELGHCFNLQHPWVKTRGNYSAGNGRYSSLSWMNCPQRYYSSASSYGEAAFWKNFQFRFTDSELKNLRHGFWNNV